MKKEHYKCRRHKYFVFKAKIKYLLSVDNIKMSLRKIKFGDKEF